MGGDSSSRLTRIFGGNGYRHARRLVWLAIRCYLVVVLVLMLLENYLIFPAPRYPAGDWTPQGLAVRDVFFESADGTRLHGWYLDHPEPRGYLLFCHGNGEHVGYLSYLLELLHEDLGLTVFAFDYRGYGRSGGSPNEQGVLADAHAAHAWLTREAGVSADEIVLMGRSLGGAVAVDLAAEYSARALVLENTFTRLPDVVGRLYWWTPARWVMRSRFDSLRKIPRFSGPLLQSHGSADQLVPIELGRQLFEAAGSRRKEFIEFPGDGHNHPRPASYYASVRRFLEQT